MNRIRAENLKKSMNKSKMFAKQNNTQDGLTQYQRDL